MTCISCTKNLNIKLPCTVRSIANWRGRFCKYIPTVLQQCHINNEPLQLAVDMTFHDNILCKCLIQFMHDMRSSVYCNKLHRLQTAIAKTILPYIGNNNGFLPYLVKDRIIFFAAENLDFILRSNAIELDWFFAKI